MTALFLFTVRIECHSTFHSYDNDDDDDDDDDDTTI